MHRQCREQAALLSPTQPNRPIACQLDRPKDPDPRAHWLACLAISHNLLRTAGALASAFHAKTRGATLRRHLIDVAPNNFCTPR
jgi:hypothetical protein